jgi:hypothetical protein
MFMMIIDQKTHVLEPRLGAEIPGGASPEQLAFRR